MNLDELFPRRVTLTLQRTANAAAEGRSRWPAKKGLPGTDGLDRYLSEP
jgi:hypothetical protein